MSAQEQDRDTWYVDLQNALSVEVDSLQMVRKNLEKDLDQITVLIKHLDITIKGVVKTEDDIVQDKMKYQERMGQEPLTAGVHAMKTTELPLSVNPISPKGISVPPKCQHLNMIGKLQAALEKKNVMLLKELLREEDKKNSRMDKTAKAERERQLRYQQLAAFRPKM